MINPLAQEVSERCRSFMDDKVFEKLLRKYVDQTHCKVTEMRPQDLGVVLNELVIPWEKREAFSVPLNYVLNGESIPFARCYVKNGKPDLSTVVML